MSLRREQDAARRRLRPITIIARLKLRRMQVLRLKRAAVVLIQRMAELELRLRQLRLHRTFRASLPFWWARRRALRNNHSSVSRRMEFCLRSSNSNKLSSSSNNSKPG